MKVKLDAFECDRCKHQWMTRGRKGNITILPKICPRCKSPYWIFHTEVPDMPKPEKNKSSYDVILEKINNIEDLVLKHMTRHNAAKIGAMRRTGNWVQPANYDDGGIGIGMEKDAPKRRRKMRMKFCKQCGGAFRSIKGHIAKYHNVSPEERRQRMENALEQRWKNNPVRKGIKPKNFGLPAYTPRRCW